MYQEGKAAKQWTQGQRVLTTVHEDVLFVMLPTLLGCDAEGHLHLAGTCLINVGMSAEYQVELYI